MTSAELAAPPTSLDRSRTERDRGRVPPTGPRLAVTLLTGGQDRSYASALAVALLANGISLEVIGSDEVDTPEMHSSSEVRFLNLRGSHRRDVSRWDKLTRIAVYYIRLIKYASGAAPQVFHILWNNKFEYFDRTVLTLFYKCRGKKVVLTTHNVNAAQRDGCDSALNRLTLRVQYRLADHIFVHTQQMKAALVQDFAVDRDAITVIPFGINNSVANTELTPAQARRRLGIEPGERTLLFFGRIGPYKGLDLLVTAFQQLAATRARYRLIIVGEPKVGAEDYVRRIQQSIASDSSGKYVIEHIGFVPDAETELYFKAADVLLLPYTQIYQSGVLFLAYAFGLPVVASDVGSFAEEIVEGETGFVCRPSDPGDLANTIERYFESDLFANLDGRRQEIRDYANRRYSWDIVGQQSRDVYTRLAPNGRA